MDKQVWVMGCHHRQMFGGVFTSKDEAMDLCMCDYCFVFPTVLNARADQTKDRRIKMIYPFQEAQEAGDKLIWDLHQRP